MKTLYTPQYGFAVMVAFVAAGIGLAIYHHDAGYAMLGFAIPVAIRSLFFLTFKK
ncbi:hypothetical protein [Chitinophaga varians]|uniref:hypothetical protein n=1 Tax=Chitinophaga varians TaxID=2202339 RepID=UPI00165EF7B6|nr:hypothetical protein [Chitinophaga varians]MBC9913159.1 hypothetical protein [Chitinophaga varians]